MGKASSSKKVARAAGIGGGRTNRGKAPVLWYSMLVAILLVGVGLTVFSRNQRLDALGSPTSKEEPRASATHWHVAFGVRVCDKWLDPVTDSNDPKGIHTHGDGIIHVHPNVASAAGQRATLARFAEAVKGEVTTNKFAWPEGGGKAKKVTHKTGDKCGEQAGEVKAFLNGELHTGDPSAIRFNKDKSTLVLAFVPKGTEYKDIGDPPSTDGLNNLSDVAPTPPAVTQSQAIDPAAGIPADPAAAPVDPAATPASSTPPSSTPPSSAPPGSSSPPSPPYSAGG